MNLNEVADLHNRRANLEIVATRAREHFYPLLVWPEDKLMMRLIDLPQIIERELNYPKDWVSLTINGVPKPIRSDAELRDFIREDFAYAIVGYTTVGTLVQEFKIRSL